MIYDCFTYCGETDQLSMRIEELSGVGHVKHIAVQGTHTFQGEPRSMSLTPDSVRNVMIEHDPNPDVDPWDREERQRDGIVYGLIDAWNDDLVIVGDADEIPRASVVSDLAERILPGRIVAMRHTTYYFALDLLCSWPHDFAPVMMRVGTLRVVGAHKARWSPTDEVPGGWHFSYLGGVDAVLAKMRAFAHSELRDTNRATIEECIDFGLDYEHRGHLIPVEINDTYPRCIRENPERWAHLLRRNL